MNRRSRKRQFTLVKNQDEAIGINARFCDYAQNDERRERWLRQCDLVCHRFAMFGYALTGEFAGLWRLRIGNYRAIVEYDDQTALVLYVAHRSEVYKNLKNKADRANDSDVS